MCPASRWRPAPHRFTAQAPRPRRARDASRTGLGLARGRLRTALLGGAAAAASAHGAFSPSGWKMRLLAAGLLLAARLCAAFYLPGLAPVSFCEEGEESEGCKVSALTAGRPRRGSRRPRRRNLPRSGFPRRGGARRVSPPRCVPASGVLPRAAPFPL